jgi:hypothetical protein
MGHKPTLAIAQNAPKDPEGDLAARLFAIKSVRCF